MKYLMLSIALVGATATASAFAQSHWMGPSATQAASNTAAAVSQNGQWVPPHGQSVASKTRNQVYQELVQAEQDGQLVYLDSTLYKGQGR
jgi:lipopolysaccharide export LptBFGC system permease protein LptF